MDRLASFGRMAFWPTLALLAAFYAFVGARMLTPRPSPEYAAYYLHRLLERWPGERGLDYPLGTIILLSRPQPYLSRSGWSAPDKAGRAVVGARAGLVLRPVAPTTGDLTWRIALRAAPRSDEGTTTVALRVNGHRLATLQAGPDAVPRIHAVLVPGELLARSADGLVRLELEDAGERVPEDRASRRPVGQDPPWLHVDWVRLAPVAADGMPRPVSVSRPGDGTGR